MEKADCQNDCEVQSLAGDQDLQSSGRLAGDNQMVQDRKEFEFVVNGETEDGSR